MTDSNQAKGGRARASKLTREERSDIARKAALARWRSKKPIQATHAGVLKLGNIEMACANLPDGRRVVSEAAMLAGLGRSYSGYYSQRDAASKHSAVYPRYLAPKVLKPFISSVLEDLQIIPYIPPGGGAVAKGLDAELIPEICAVWLKARDAGKLSGVQLQTAAKAEIMVIALARVGIIALIDEATGFQYERQRDALQELLEEILSDKLRRWVKTFPDTYFRELCRLRGVKYRPDMKLPQYFGHLTNDLIYKRLHPGLLEKLKEMNPKVGGRRKHKHFQRLSAEHGDPRLFFHFGLLDGLMKTYDNYEDFKAKLDEIAPVYGELPLFDGGGE